MTERTPPDPDALRPGAPPTGLKDDGSRRSHREGWEASLDNLDRVLAA